MGHHCQYRASPLLFRFLSPVITILFAFTANGFAADPQLKIDDARFDDGAIVKFLAVGSDHVPATDAIKKMAAGQTDDAKYTVFADLDSIIVNPSFENYDFYVRTNSGANSSLIRYTFQVTPYDTFPDQNKTIQVHLIEPGQDRTAQLSIPVHSLKAGVALSATPSATVKISLSGDTVSVDLQNKYLLPVTITAARVGEVTKAHWTARPELETQLPITLGSDESNNRTTLRWKVQPRAAGVLRDSIWPLASNAPPRGATQSSDAFETLDFSIDYVAAQGGFPHTLKTMRGLTFYPSLPALLSLAVVGGIVGGLIMFFGIRKDSGPKKFLKYLGPNLALAIFIELLAIVLFSFDNSKVQIGVVNLNPTLLIPATCLGAISVLYGFKLVEKWLGKAGPESEAGGD